MKIISNMQGNIFKQSEVGKEKKSIKGRKTFYFVSLKANIYLQHKNVSAQEVEKLLSKTVSVRIRFPKVKMLNVFTLC